MQDPDPDPAQPLVGPPTRTLLAMGIAAPSDYASANGDAEPPGVRLSLVGTWQAGARLRQSRRQVKTIQIDPIGLGREAVLDRRGGRCPATC